MKKIACGSVLQFSLSFILFYLLIAQVSFAQDCKTQAANKPSALVRGTDDVYPTGKMNSLEMAKMKPHLAKAENWVKKMMTNFTGAKLLYHNIYFPDYLNNGTTHETFYKATGIKSFYISRMMFFAYYCYDNSNTIHTEGESGSTVNVVFNNVFSFGPTSDAGVYTINGKPAFKIIQKKRSEGRIDFYEQRAQNNANAKMYTTNDYILLRNSDKPVFIAITRKEYLEQMLKDVEAFKTREMASAKQEFTPANEAANRARFDEELKRIDNSKNYSKEQMAPYRKAFIEKWETEKQKFDRRMAQVEKESNESKDVLLEYLKKPAEWLNRNFRSFYSYSTYTAAGVTQFVEGMDKISMNGVGEIEEDTQQEIVNMNPAYFNKSLSSDVPQLIMVNLRNGNYTHMLKVGVLVKQPGALAPLEAIVNPGKSTSPVVALTEIVSNYVLSYLPKLKTLTPLVVPAGMKSSAIPVTTNYNNPAPAAAVNFTLPPVSEKLNQLPQLTTTGSYISYVQQLHIAISNAVKPAEKKKADNYATNKKITQSKQISNSAFDAWLQNAPMASLYLYSKAVATNSSDALAANNFSAFLIMSGLPEKSIPILEYWNKQKPNEVPLLSNLGNAYYRLGDMDKAMKYLQQCVRKDSLHPTANKILCVMYLKKGNQKNAKDHGTKSLTSSHDEQVVAILRQIDNKTKAGEIMSRLPAKEFPLLKRILLPAMPSTLEDMEAFVIEVGAEKKSIALTIENIESKMATLNDNDLQAQMMAGLGKGMSPLQIKAQHIIMDGMQAYHKSSIEEADVFNYHFKTLTAPYNVKCNAINKKYAAQLNKLEGGEAGDEDEIAALELANCKEINAEKEKYIAVLSPLVNKYAQRREFISRKFYRDYANWGPYWMPGLKNLFVTIERDYLKAISGILSEYKMVTKSNCEAFEPLPKKEGKLKEWEDEYCANFKGKFAFGAGKFIVTCNSWGIEGGEGIVGDIEIKFRDDGSFEDFTVSAGLGVSWHLGKEDIIKTEIALSGKDFIKIGIDKSTGKWMIKDAGFKAEVGGEAGIGKIAVEEKVLELSFAVNAGFEAGGILAPAVLYFK